MQERREDFFKFTGAAAALMRIKVGGAEELTGADNGPKEAGVLQTNHRELPEIDSTGSA